MLEELYPENEKIKAVKEKSQAIGEFLEWLGEKKIHLVTLKGEHGYDPVYTNTENLLAEFFEIDLDEVEEEKLQMLEELRKLNAKG